jgi:methylmalonyl-CoA mutase N-terminal domain/subunit
VAATADPLAGSYVVEALTDALEAEARELIEHLDAMGGAVAAIEQGWMQGQIAEAAYQYQQRVESSEQVVVGVNRFAEKTDSARMPIFQTNDAVAREQVAALTRLRAERDNAAVSAALGALRKAALGTENVLYPMRAALKSMATVGEVCGVLRAVWGEYRPEVRL